MHRPLLEAKLICWYHKYLLNCREKTKNDCVHGACNPTRKRKERKDNFWCVTRERENLAEPVAPVIITWELPPVFTSQWLEGQRNENKTPGPWEGVGRMCLQDWPVSDVVSGKHAQVELAPTGLGRFGHAWGPGRDCIRLVTRDWSSLPKGEPTPGLQAWRVCGICECSVVSVI